MSNPLGQDLGTGFEPVGDREWREAAAKGDPEADLRAEVEPGLEVDWLYVSSDALAPDPGGAPGEPPFVRGATVGSAWTATSRISAPDRGRARGQVAEELANGIRALEIRLDLAARRAAAPGSSTFHSERGVDGVAISILGHLEEVLEPADLAEVELAVDAGAASLAAAGLLAALWRRCSSADAPPRGSLRIDPLGTLAAGEALTRPPEEEMSLAAALAREIDSTYPTTGEAGKPPRRERGITVFTVATTAYVEAGASAAWELAIAIATGIEYLRACERAGLPPERAAARIEFALCSGPDQFLEIAKLRAIRRLWERVTEVSASFSGAERGRSPIVSVGSERMMTSLDPWTNMLRGTTSAFAAAVGGADAIVVNPFDSVYSGWPGREPDPEGGEADAADSAGPGWLGRRIARNTNHILQREAALASLTDPAGGSWYVEALTDELARQAWSLMQEIERQGGAKQALVSGFLGESLREISDVRSAELARRQRLMTGVNIYPKLGGDRVRIETSDREDLARGDAERLGDLGAGPSDGDLREAVERTLSGADQGIAGEGAGLLEALEDLARSGASIDQIAAAITSDEFTIEPLHRARDAEPFERLRAAAVAEMTSSGERPRVLLACLGPIARHLGVANWAKSFFEVAGIEAVNSVEVAGAGPVEELEDPADVAPEAEDLGRVLTEVGAAVAAVCAGRDEPVEAVRAAVSALRDAGASRVYLVTPTPEQAEGSGADEVVADGVDMIEVLTKALRHCGVEVEQGPGDE